MTLRTKQEIEEYLKVLPNPVGYRLLIKPYAGKNKTKGGIYLSEKTKETIEMTTVVGYVVKMGDLCYKDEKKFPSGAWCKEGQFVVYGRYSGARFKTKYGEHRILNDDEIIGTINKPEDILALF
jgi:co-chaperonin GroES (HSP10)